MTAGLEGRGEPLRVLGWNRRQADWIALVCLNGSYFTREQLAAFLGVGVRHAFRVVRKMVEEKIAAEAVLERRKVCRINSNRIYRALGLHPRRGYTVHSPATILVHLLALDYLVERPGLPWLPTEAEKVHAFEAAGIPRELLPSRLSGGGAPGQTRYFPYRSPVAFGGDRALFTLTDQGYASTRPLREWTARHRRLWEALRERGHPVEVVVIVRTVPELRRAQGRLENWSRATDHREEGAVTLEIERIERAILGRDAAALESYGDVQSALRRLNTLREREQRIRTPLAIDGCGAWRSARIPAEWL